MPMNMIASWTVPFMPAPTKPGLGFELNHATVEKAIAQIERSEPQRLSSAQIKTPTLLHIMQGSLQNEYYCGAEEKSTMNLVK